MRRSTGSRKRWRQGGYVLVTAVMFGLSFVGALALVVDLGRLYLLKSETQARADAAVLAAAARLDGSLQGMSAAAQLAAHFAGPSARAQVAFSTSPEGPWSHSSDATEKSTFVRVQLQAHTPVFFGRWITGNAAGSVGAMAAAGQIERTGSKASDFPCPASDLVERLRQDTDRDSASYEEYAAAEKGNGRRITPCGTGNGVSGYFVSVESGGKEPIGAYVEGSRRRGAAAQPGYYLVRLVG